jgi:hypothetical protein
MSMRISSNGLIRLSIEELLSTPITHLVSGVDAQNGPQADSCGTVTSISGYTEWVSTREPIISIGWDWCIQLTPSGLHWSRVGWPSSNVLLVEGGGCDTDWERSRDILATVIDALPWREQLPQLVAARYA